MVPTSRIEPKKIKLAFITVTPYHVLQVEPMVIFDIGFASQLDRREEFFIDG